MFRLRALVIIVDVCNCTFHFEHLMNLIHHAVIISLSLVSYCLDPSKSVPMDILLNIYLM